MRNSCIILINVFMALPGWIVDPVDTNYRVFREQIISKKKLTDLDINLLSSQVNRLSL